MSKGIIKKIFLAVLLGLIGFLAYHQFLFKAKHVDSNLFKLDKVLVAHQSDVWVVKFAPNGTWLASGSVDSCINIWSNENGKLIHSIRQPAGVTYLDISPDGNFLISTSYDSKARLWKMPEGILLKEFSGHKGTVWSVEFSPDGKSIVTSGEDASIKLWDVSTGQLTKTLLGHRLTVWDVKFSPDGKKLASGSFDKTIRIWNVEDGKLLRTLDAHAEAVVSLAFSHDGQKLVSTSDDKTIKLWNTNNWSLIYSLHMPEHPQASAFSNDDKLLVTGGRDKPAIGEFLQNFLGDSKYNKGVSMRLWNVTDGKLLQTFSFHSNDVNDVSFSADGNRIASASSDHTIGLWKLSK